MSRKKGKKEGERCRKSNKQPIEDRRLGCLNQVLKEGL